IGFSGVLFALKVLLNHNSPTFSSVYGFQVPTKYAAWLELVVIHYLVPHSSFMGHMCGIL
uniref:Peptidase S54 rhomboid domain-containing protein n=1 Tax=Globisporangium ultimum (strain ATCC 200006 / CBS 805.95 / DAOM BR144) TaxID=431595 RepID=K3WGF9_GLOUD